MPGFTSHLVLGWQQPEAVHFLERLASFARVIVFDKRGTGLAVHIGARVMSVAAADEVLVSRTVKELVAGASVDFEDRGVQTLKGGPGVRTPRIQP